jgi:hypothetical protein
VPGNLNEKIRGKTDMTCSNNDLDIMIIAGFEATILGEGYIHRCEEYSRIAS